MRALGRITQGSHIAYYNLIAYYFLMFFIAYAFKGQGHVFAGRVTIVSHSSCRTSAILKYFCPLIVFRVGVAAEISIFRLTNKVLITLGEYACLCMPLECMKQSSFFHNITRLILTNLANCNSAPNSSSQYNPFYKPSPCPQCITNS